MPGPVAHIIFAVIALSNSSNKWDQKDFIRGTNFPDIRYFGVIEREKTHLNDVTWEQIKKEKSSFKSGFLFHSLIDKRYDEFIKKNDICSKLPEIPKKEIFFKLYGDIVLYEKISQNDWQNVLDFFKDLSGFQEKSFNIKEESINRWYDLLANYCKQKPSSKSIGQILNSLKLDDFSKILIEVTNMSIKEIFYDIIEQLATNKELNQFIFSFHYFVEKEIKEQLGSANSE